MNTPSNNDFTCVHQTAASDGVKVGHAPDISDNWVTFRNKKDSRKYLGLDKNLQTYIGKGANIRMNSNWWECDPDVNSKNLVISFIAWRENICNLIG